MRKYETIGGVVTRGETLAKLNFHLNEARDQAYVLSHLHNTEDSPMDKLLAKGWMGMGDLIKRMCWQVTELAKNKLQ